MTHTDSELDFSRIDYLLNPRQFHDKLVTVVGLGSGGAFASDHLTMNGIRRWHLYDPDTLDPVNLVKHPRGRRDLGRMKVDVERDWILDRNPSAEVEVFPEDVIGSGSFLESVGRSDLVLSCPDSKAVREFVNDVCVSARKPSVTASVFRTGIGGEVYGYMPGRTGCYQCLQLYSLTHGLDLTDEALGLTKEEEERVYGFGQGDFQASGLSIDIQTIALIQVRMALAFLTRKTSSHFSRLKSNWIVFGNRPAHGVFSKHFEASQLLLRPQKDCTCERRIVTEGES